MAVKSVLSRGIVSFLVSLLLSALLLKAGALSKLYHVVSAWFPASSPEAGGLSFLFSGAVTLLLGGLGFLALTVLLAVALTALTLPRGGSRD
jgi:hypothetical protein